MPQADNLYIQNLPGECTEQHLQDIFSPFGTVVSTKVSKSGNKGTSIGFVKYSNGEEADLAISQCNGTVPGDFATLMQSGMMIRLADTPEEKANKAAGKGGGKGWDNAPGWGGAPGGYGAAAAGTVARYSPYPTAPGAPAAKGGKGKGPEGPYGAQPGYGYGAAGYGGQAGYGAQGGGYGAQPGYGAAAGGWGQPYQELAPAKNALGQSAYEAALNYFSFFEHPVTGKGKGRKGGGGSPDANLYVFGLAQEVDECGLYVLFAPFGGILSIKLMKNQQGEGHRGFGFVQFTDAAAAQHAIASLDGTALPGGKKLIVQMHDKAGAGGAPGAGGKRGKGGGVYAVPGAEMQ